MTRPAADVIRAPVTEAIVELGGVDKHYRSGGKLLNHVLRRVDLTVERGEFVAIVGTSGSGKSTLLNIIGGLDRDYEGDVRVAGRELAALSDGELSAFRNAQVGFVFQQFNLLEHLSCAENVAMPAVFSAGRRRADAEQRAIEVLDRVGMAARARDLPANLSGGQKQRVAIARSLFNAPELLLCDEATGNLDTTTGRQIIELFGALNDQDQITLVMVTHEARVSSAAHRVVRIEDGRIGAADEAAPGVGVR